MAELAKSANRFFQRKHIWLILASFGIVAVSVFWPKWLYETVVFILENNLQVAPLVVPGILISAWVNASGAGENIKRVFEANLHASILMASAVGALTPVCGLCVLPLMVGLLVSGVPFAPVMAFWLSSPITDPAMLAATTAVLGLNFAIGKTIAAFAIGVFGGYATVALSSTVWIATPLKQGGLVGALATKTCGEKAQFIVAVWKHNDRKQQMLREIWAMAKLVFVCLSLAFTAERLLQGWLQPEALSMYVGSGAWWAIPLAVFVGAPMYLDGYAALPLVRAMIDFGMSSGAAMGFLISGGIVSIWGAMAIFPVLKTKPFVFFLILAVAGSLLAGWSYEFAVS